MPIEKKQGEFLNGSTINNNKNRVEISFSLNDSLDKEKPQNG
jgi:hypothetical protein